ncbi:N-acetylglucosamine-6-phosphate deacetylase [Granulicella tundricola]|uniref:N-acetylglucosamine-6-phosphate deacetylase n=1 Tax=Granulicella tundricola (strain ATCC BAA-1859 / DSM 23138 / MP5ACTX9) TaxID=1198114 RepID=E8X1W3_GRATM|nr:N-acetylglucosamine-6-phosphate deacetylase [Granulicella tundricola]ADW69124.1 N-acetylglucosamine-6-phosphate deacetylase [Granulicella tundricola MP5ACTX9]
MPILTARTLITAIGTVEYPAITIGPTGLIEDISTDPTIRSTAILTPTFLDIHFHGAAGEDLMAATPEGISKIQRFLATRGTSHYLPTTVTAPIDDTLRALEHLADAIEHPSAPGEATPLGIHLEGPFLSHIKRGVHPTELLQKPSIALFDRFQQAARGHIKLLTIAPESEGALELITYATHQGIRVTMGHTNATAAETNAAIVAGATSGTHTFNAMRALDHREPGIVGVILDRDDLFSDLICDGIHVAPALVRLWFRLKQEKAILITDAMSATGMPDGEYHLGSFAVTVKDHRCTLTDAPDTLAGSVLTLDQAVANLQSFTNATLAQAVRCASSHPARMLGLEDTIASLRPGQPATFNQYTPEGRLEATYLQGHRT